MDKQTLRAIYKEIRLRMSRSEVSTKSRIITSKLINDIDWNKYLKVCFFSAILNLNEVDISGLIKRLERDPSVQITLITRSKTAKLPSDSFDLILVPALAFDEDNYRLGWGGGWYDKFLASQPKALKIGVCFQNGYAKKLPHESYDIPLDQVITEI